MTRVLVAADSPADRRLLVSLLESDAQFEVVAQADNGVEAVDLAVRLSPDMVAMDLQLPLLDGVEATKEIMARAPTRIVIVSASENGPGLGRGVDALRAGALTIVPKPNDPKSPQFNLRREIFLEMVRAATRKVVPRQSDWQDGGGPLGMAWLRPELSFSSPWAAESTTAGPLMDGAVFRIPKPFTIQDRAERIRQLLDEEASWLDRQEGWEKEEGWKEDDWDAA
ncbi:MAG: response regulator [Gemmatimonadetes bacterium]|nr:response regulator [Gemmatimonadota bacterium]